MSALYELMVEIEKHSALRAHARLVSDARAELFALEADRERLQKETWSQYEKILEFDNKLSLAESVIEMARKNIHKFPGNVQELAEAIAQYDKLKEAR